MKQPTRFEQGWPWAVRLLGVAIAMHEVLWTNEDRASVLLLASGMIFFKTILEYQNRDGDPK
jgi:hypothetical protein